MKKIILILTILSAIFMQYGIAHADNEKAEDSVVAISNTNNIIPATPMVMTTFSTYHPLIVHFPIVLLIVAAVLQLIYLKYTNKVLRNITIGITAAGLLGAYLSGSFFHPHTAGLPESARIILEEHEKLSAYALYTALAAFLLQVANLFVKRKMILDILITFILAGSAIFVSLSGHHGAMLTHIEGVGPQGKYIKHHHH